MEALGEPRGRLGRAGVGPGGVLGGPGAVLEAYKRRLGGSLGRLGAVLRALEAMLEPSGCQKAPKMEPKRVPNRAPEATRAEYGETLIFNASTQDFHVFFESQTTMFELKLGSKWVPNCTIDAEGVGKPLDRYLGRYDRALEGILAAPGRILAAIYGPLGRTRLIGKHQAGTGATNLGRRHPPLKHLSYA